MQRLADELGVNQSQVSKWLHTSDRRRVVPKARTLRKIAELTGAPYSQLRQFADPEDVDEDEARELDPDLAVVTAAWPGLDQGLRRAIKILVGAGAAGFTSYKPWGSAFATGA